MVVAGALIHVAAVHAVVVVSVLFVLAFLCSSSVLLTSGYRQAIHPSYLVLFTFSTVPYVKCMSLYLEVCAPTWASTFCVLINKVVFIH